MFGKKDLYTELDKVRSQTRTEEDRLIQETFRILNQDRFTERKILENLKHYNDSFAVLDEQEVDAEAVFTLSEIRRVAIQYRLKFLDSKKYKPEIPAEAVLRIRDLNAMYHRELKEFKVLSTPASFGKRQSDEEGLLFAKTNEDNFYLVHRWGNTLSRGRKLWYWPLRTFETLAVTLILFTLALTMSLPTWVITLDHTATYWCGYRAGVFFHLLIFNSAFTTFGVFSFAGHFNSGLWNRHNDLD